MIEAMLTSPFFGLTISIAAWCGGVWIQKKTKWVLCNPLLIASLAIIAVLAVFHIPLADYNQGGDIIKMMLGPVTAVLALNIYDERKVLKEYFFPVLVGCLVGTVASVAIVLGLCHLFQLDDMLTASLMPKSVTTAIAVGISESRGGTAGITAAAVVLAGVVGAVFAPLFAKWFRVTEPVAQGLATGACSHALGTAKAMEMGELQGAMSSIAICVCGIFTSIIAMFF